MNKSFPKFKTVVATLERERNLLGLVGLLDVLLITDEVYTAFMQQVRFDAPHFENELDRGSALHALLKHASYLGDDLEEIDDVGPLRVGPHNDVACVIDGEVTLAPRIDVVEVERVVDPPGLGGVELPVAVDGAFRVCCHVS